MQGVASLVKNFKQLACSVWIFFWSMMWAPFLSQMRGLPSMWNEKEEGWPLPDGVTCCLHGTNAWTNRLHRKVVQHAVGILFLHMCPIKHHMFLQSMHVDHMPNVPAMHGIQTISLLVCLFIWLLFYLIAHLRSCLPVFLSFFPLVQHPWLHLSRTVVVLECSIQTPLLEELR